ncbi:MAG: hypothetical protein ACYDA3_05565 [Gaiellaceae bacterium]
MSWDLDAYAALLDSASGYRIAHFDHEPRENDLFLRHDVDLSLDAALVVAELDAARDISATFFLMKRSVFYNLDSPEGERVLSRLRELGHRVGLHALHPHVDHDDRFDRVLAWHNPEPEFMSERVAGLINVMSPPWFDPAHYRSESNQRWRNGDPTGALAAHEFDWLQLLIHPEIWVYDGATMRETMASMLAAEREARWRALEADRIDLS